MTLTYDQKNAALAVGTVLIGGLLLSAAIDQEKRYLSLIGAATSAVALTLTIAKSA